jgi:hypothetical protein
MTVCDTALGQVVWGKLHRDPVTCEHADSVSTEFAGQVGENGTVGIELNTKQTTRELFNDCSCHFNAIFFTHLPLRC